jgi:hypothetical protein
MRPSTAGWQGTPTARAAKCPRRQDARRRRAPPNDPAAKYSPACRRVGARNPASESVWAGRRRARRQKQAWALREVRHSSRPAFVIAAGCFRWAAPRKTSAAQVTSAVSIRPGPPRATIAVRGLTAPRWAAGARQTPRDLRRTAESSVASRECSHRNGQMRARMDSTTPVNPTSRARSLAAAHRSMVVALREPR